MLAKPPGVLSTFGNGKGADMAFCANCGMELTEGLRFCPQCGTPTPEGVATEAPMDSTAVTMEAEPPAAVATTAPSAPAAAPSMVTSAPEAAKEATVAAVREAANLIMHDVEAPATAGEVVLSSWQGGGAVPGAVQAVAGVAQAAQQVRGAVQQAQGIAQTAQQAQGVVRGVQDATQPMQQQYAQPTQQMPQQQYAQPTQQMPQQGMPYAPNPSPAVQPERKKSKLPLIAALVGGAALIAVIALFVVPLFIPHPVDPFEGKTNVPPSS